MRLFSYRFGGIGPLRRILSVFVCVWLLQSAACASFSKVGEPRIPHEEERLEQVVSQPPLISDRLNSPSAALYTEAYFRHFIKKHRKAYRDVHEYEHRLKIFRRNLARALHHQALDPTAVHGITPFLDLSEEEFDRDFLGLRDPDSRLFDVGAFGSGANAGPAPILPVDGLPRSIDWREKGAVTDVKTQGLCGACWAFTTTGVFEGAHFLATGKLIKFSEQQLIDCDKKCDPVKKESCDSGCHGGLMTNAYEYINEVGGLMKAEDYPYKAAAGQCEFTKDKVAVRLQNFRTISLDEDQIAANLVQHGPLAVGLNAAFMQTYIGGVSCPLICSKHFVNHGVLLVGYEERGFSSLRFSYKPYWILKNSWGPHWGEKGYYKLCRGLAECGMNTMVSSVAVNLAPDSAVE